MRQVLIADSQVLDSQTLDSHRRSRQRGARHARAARLGGGFLLVTGFLLLGQTGCRGLWCLDDHCEDPDTCWDGNQGCGGAPVDCDCARDPYGGNSNCGCANGGECVDDWDCGPDGRCDQGVCWWDDPTYCEQSQECGPDRVCGLWYECEDVVSECPLTDECLADPEGYTPEWQGIDPRYVGEVSGGGVTARLEWVVDFYSDHLYGDLLAVVMTEGGWEESYDLVVTGSRSGASLEGQVVERVAGQRQFDITFVATLQTATAVDGVATVSWDGGTLEVPFHLWRTSPCGCDPAQLGHCAGDADCGSGERCDGGACVPVCQAACCSDSDCGSGERCDGGACVPACQAACCSDADCGADEACVDGACLLPCTTNCDCPAGQVCQEGYCATP